ncbi:hypothetical protein [Fusobacterium sp. PH5-44]|uniref:hypothetical protein n=1 Tax=unclassified Fusobacterium TaxID=2648384 RepID=UPI003D212E7F
MILGLEVNPDKTINGEIIGIEFSKLLEMESKGLINVYAGREGKPENIDVNMADGAHSFTGKTEPLYGKSFEEIDKRQFEIDKAANKNEVVGTAILLTAWAVGGGSEIRYG